jgi:quinolinate synthase
VLESEDGAGQEIFVDPDVGTRAMVPLNRMLEFSRSLKR